MLVLCEYIAVCCCIYMCSLGQVYVSNGQIYQSQFSANCGNSLGYLTGCVCVCVGVSLCG